MTVVIMIGRKVIKKQQHYSVMGAPVAKHQLGGRFRALCDSHHVATYDLLTALCDSNHVATYDLL